MSGHEASKSIHSGIPFPSSFGTTEFQFSAGKPPGEVNVLLVEPEIIHLTWPMESPPIVCRHVSVFPPDVTIRAPAARP